MEKVKHDQIEIRNFQSSDMVLLGELYNAVRSNGNPVFWWVGNEDNWQNVFCAFENGRMIAKGQVEVVNIISPGSSREDKHEIYINLKTIPERESDYNLLEKLYCCLHQRALELKETLSNQHGTILCLGNDSQETANNNFFSKEKGFKNLNFLYTMSRDLNIPIPQLQLTAEFNFIQWKMETPAEESMYLEFDSEIWPDRPLGLKKLTEYKQYPLWTNMIAREKDTLVASLMVWKEESHGIIEDVFVRELWRGRGIGKYLLTKALVYLKDNGLESAQLEVLTSNESALSLYESVGFLRENIEVRYFIVLD